MMSYEPDFREEIFGNKRRRTERLFYILTIVALVAVLAWQIWSAGR